VLCVMLDVDQLIKHCLSPPPDNQRKALCKLLDSLTNDHSGAKIRGHNEVSAKACPGFSVPKFLKNNLNASPKQSKLKGRIRSAVKNWGISHR